MPKGSERTAASPWPLPKNGPMGTSTEGADSLSHQQRNRRLFQSFGGKRPSRIEVDGGDHAGAGEVEQFGGGRIVL